MSECQPLYWYIGGNGISNWSFYARQTHSDSCIKRHDSSAKPFEDGEMVSEMVKSGKSCAREAISPENEQGETVTVPSYDGMVTGKLLLLILCVVELSLPSKSQHFTHKFFSIHCTCIYRDLKLPYGHDRSPHKWTMTNEQMTKMNTTKCTMTESNPGEHVRCGVFSKMK